MKRCNIFLTMSIFCALALSMQTTQAQTDTTFTYQGRLDQNGQPVNGVFDLDFALFDADVGGNQIDAEIMLDSVPIVDGLLTVDLDFGGASFDNGERWLRIKVNNMTLNPRQPISRTPYAIQTRGLFVDDFGNTGIGTTTPLNSLHIVGNAAALRLEDDGDPASFLLLEAFQPGQLRLNNVANAGISLIDINPMSISGTANAHVRVFRETNTTGSKSMIFHSGNNSTATSAVIGVGGNPSVFQLDGGNFGIGTATPTAKLDVRGDIKFGASGQFFASGGGERLRIIRGNVAANGMVLAGAGFSCLRSNVGVYIITYVTPFSGNTTLTATSAATALPSRRIVECSGTGTNSDTTGIVTIVNLAGDLVDGTFSFIAIGPQ